MILMCSHHDAKLEDKTCSKVRTGDERAAGMRTEARENQKMLYAITSRPASHRQSLTSELFQLQLAAANCRSLG